MRKWNYLLAGLAILLVILIATSPKLGLAAPFGPTPTAKPASDAEKTELEKALRGAALSNQKIMPAFLVYQVVADNVVVSKDDKTAVIWMGLVDPKTNQALATEPGLAIGQRADASAAWQITLPTNPDWANLLQGLPDSLLSKDVKAQYAPTELNVKTAASAQVFTGYLLPWEGGKRVWLTGSVAHFTTYNSCSWVTVNGDYHSTCRYAFDFSDGTNFRVLAARGGSVIGWRDTCVNNDHTCLNYLALEDRSTSPVTTQLYLHLSQNSIPAGLKANAVNVNQGDFIALADNTGMSTGSHLHFMVVANRWMGSGYGDFWWGDSVDISFSDVDINGGRPRLCSEAYYTPQYGTQCHPANQSAGQTYDNWFISGNRGSTPPTASLSAPAAFTAVTSSSVTISGAAASSSGIARIKVIANYDNSWKEIGTDITSNPFSTSVDLCAAGVPNGPVTLGLWAWDVDGNRSTLPQDPRPINMNSTCPPPAPKCMPSPDQIALYSQPDYLGNCQVFGIGKYSDAQLGALGDNQAASILVGARVMAQLYQGNYEDSVLKGRSETFLSNDAGLADNRIGVQQVSSLEVKTVAKPDAPILRKVYNRVDASSNPMAPTSNDSNLLTWKSDNNPPYPPDEGGTYYQVTLTYPNGAQWVTPWQTANSFSVGSLPAGSYTWTVTAYNLAGVTTSAPASFSVTAASPLGGAAQTVPYSDSFDNGVNGWTADGIWRQGSPPVGSASNNDKTLAWGFNNGSDYADSTVAAGSLTSPSLSIPAGGAFLKFRYYAATEDSGPYWDQRRVQIAVNGGAFQDLVQLTDDPQGVWQYSQAINLAAYAGNSVRIRFYFNIVDKYANANPGWWIDDFSVTTTGADTSCTEDNRDDSAATATPVELNQSLPASICPQGDLDFYSFTANAGAAVSIDVVAKAVNSSLDPYLYLLDGDGSSVLAENDDVQYGVQQDSHIQYTIQRSGTYYIKVKAYNHPGVGGPDYFYYLVMHSTGQAPTVSIGYPYNNWISPTPFVVSANAAGPNGVTHVDFYWHGSDWRNGTWDLIASDTNGADGWSATFNPSGKTIAGSALVARAYDAAGQESASVIWNLQTDTTPPVTNMQALPASSPATLITLNWGGSDNGTGMNHYEIQYRDNGGAWSALGTTFPAQQTWVYFVGSGEHTYDFRMRGVDNAGNAGAFATTPNTTTQIAATCTPDAFDAEQPGDGSPANAKDLAMLSPQNHNFCPAGDQDWLRFNAQGGVSYRVQVVTVANGATAAVTVTDASGQKVLAQVNASDWGQMVQLKFTAPSSGEYRVMIQPFDNRLWGSNEWYSVEIGESNWYYVPVAKK